ncbi:hypothetical protein M8998_11945 [Sphingobacterium sp. lm-10]|uniref:hypothetical protein n=1 Tax=Sphingobacterium sp. lm-10 TaxID=2944904 RepID=UPI0020226D2F|nr:hypothetical protein [Sphingobacterium sp. lm-10]MCL7988650.1 hypothetical protein [Sphingobacterium sp. lm-10]
MNTSAEGNIISLLRKWLDIIIYVSIGCEMIFFPSWANLAGCGMTLLVWLIFKIFFLKQYLIVLHPFSFFAFLSLFLARYIPLPATLLEGKPITYGFEAPYQTFFWETIMFVVAALAFYFATRKNISKNNFLQNFLYKQGFFKTDTITLWILGAIGLAVRIQQLSVANEVEFGDVNNKFLAGLVYLQYAPLIMLFPKLANISANERRNVFVWLYVGLLFVTSFATNSRQAMIYPIFTIALLAFLHTLRERISVFKLISPARLVVLSVTIIFGLNLISDVSLAMLVNRSGRSDISRSELFDKTWETLQDDEVMERLRMISAEESDNITAYNLGWDETYLSNFMLNRYGNLRVSDQTLYYADKVGYGNEKMRDSFIDKVTAIFPLPFLSFLGIHLDKDELLYSPGDMLFTTAGNLNALGGFRVTSLVADGLATFGYWAFPLQFILLFLSFKLMDCFVFYRKKRLVYSTLGLINVFGFLGMFRNSIGVIVLVTYLLRGFWQECFIFWLVVFIVKLLPIKR